MRNGNSSRFGKWTEIQLDPSGFLAASRITAYLLEKSRVAEHAAGERNYHVLYQVNIVHHIVFYQVSSALSK